MLCSVSPCHRARQLLTFVDLQIISINLSKRPVVRSEAVTLIPEDQALLVPSIIACLLLFVRLIVAVSDFFSLSAPLKCYFVTSTASLPRRMTLIATR